MFFINLLQLIDIFEYVFGVFSGTYSFKTKDKEMFILNIFFRNNAVNKVFFSFLAIAVLICLILSIAAFIKRGYSEKNRKTLGRIIGGFIKTVAIMCIIPICCLIVINLSSLILNKVISEVNDNDTSSPTMGTYMYLAFLESAEGNNGALKKGDLTSGLNHLNEQIGEINYYIGIPVCILMLGLLIICAFVFIIRMFEILILFITAPFFAISFITDEGKRFGKWGKMFITRLLSGVGMVIMVKVYFIVIPLVLDGSAIFSHNSETNLLVKSTFLVGGLWAAYKFGSLISTLLINSEDKNEHHVVKYAFKSSRIILDEFIHEKEQKLLKSGK